jgi:hypothetical protein
MRRLMNLASSLATSVALVLIVLGVSVGSRTAFAQVRQHEDCPSNNCSANCGNADPYNNCGPPGGGDQDLCNCIDCSCVPNSSGGCQCDGD